MSDDIYYEKLAALNEDFRCWVPFQPPTGRKEEFTRDAVWEASTSSSASCESPAKEYNRAGFGVRNKRKYWPPQKICSFCRQSGTDRSSYESHRLRDESGRLECPILRAHACECCGATGDEAHTVSYCPVLKAAGIEIPKTALILKNTLYTSSGFRRYPRYRN